MSELPEVTLDALRREAIRLGLNVEQAERALVERLRAALHHETHTREGLEPLPPWAEDEAESE